MDVDCVASCDERAEAKTLERMSLRKLEYAAITSALSTGRTTALGDAAGFDGESGEGSVL